MSISTSRRARDRARGRRTPRIVNRLLKRVRDHPRSTATAAGEPRRSRRCASSSRRRRPRLDDASCSSRSSRSSLPGLGRRGARGRVSEEVETIEDVYEPYLLRLGFLGGRRGSDRDRGRAKPPCALGYEIRRPADGAGHRPLWDEQGSGSGARDGRRSHGRRHIGATNLVRGPHPAAARRPDEGAPRAGDAAPRVIETPQFMPVGTNATVKALHPDDLEGAAPASSSRTPITSSCGRPRAIERLGAAALHELQAADPHRLGRVPGRLARGLAEDRRRRRDVPEPHRRLDTASHANVRRSASRKPSGLTSPGFDHPVLPVVKRELVPGRDRGTHAGRSAASPRMAGTTRPARRHPGRPGAGSAGGFDALHRLASRSTA